eukprot:6198476-Pleurochrysis_carterae.AAC.4
MTHGSDLASSAVGRSAWSSRSSRPMKAARLCARDPARLAKMVSGQREAAAAVPVVRHVRAWRGEHAGIRAG